MKAYQAKFHQMLIKESVADEQLLVASYSKLFDGILNTRNIIDLEIYEILNLNNYTISSRPFVIEPILRKKTLPAFHFLIAKN